MLPELTGRFRECHAPEFAYCIRSEFPRSWAMHRVAARQGKAIAHAGGASRGSCAGDRRHAARFSRSRLAGRGALPPLECHRNIDRTAAAVCSAEAGAWSGPGRCSPRMRLRSARIFAACCVRFEAHCAALAEEALGSASRPDLKGRDGDLVVQKTLYSEFIQSAGDLHVTLKARGIEAVLVVDIITNVCCEAAAGGAMMPNGRTMMIHDAVRRCATTSTPRLSAFTFLWGHGRQG